ncbi:MAG TPA: glycosyltransferase [Bryobacteraceae bacterium]|nr:glycosyltransferase [Bryobacteraceae bacterium]
MSISERLRILHITPSFGVGGAEQMAGHLMVSQSKSHDVMATSLYPATGSSIEHRLRRANIPLWHLGKRPGFDPRLFASVDRVLNEAGPDVVHTHLSVLRYALPGLVRRQIPVVVHTLHNVAEHETDLFGRIVQWFAFRRSVLPVAISREVASSVKRVYGVECRSMVPNCIPIESYRRSTTDRFRWREKERFGHDAILFACVGRLEPQKNPLLLVQAFAALDDPRAHLVMLGEGSLREQLAAYIRRHGLHSRVHLLGKRNEVPECLAASDVFAISSDWEGTPLAVMEAMAAGLPVIGTAVGGVPELVESGQHGFLVPPGDCAAFSNAMRTLLNNPVLREVMGASARARAAAKFNIDRMADGYTRLYWKALSASGRRTSAAA